MSAFTFRPASRSEAKPLIGLYAESGCGKTLSALYLARGFVGPTGKIGMIETESGRGEAYADILPGSYSVLSIRDDFSPRRYGEAITAAERAGLGALIIDSASHEWESAGGVLSMAADNQAAGKTGVIVWQKPKMEHQQHFMLRLLATPIPLVIVCMRAKYPMLEKKKPDGKKEWVRSTDLDPKQSDDILFEMFLHGWIDKEHKFHGTKYTRPDLAEIIRDGEPISIKTGELLAEWARGGTPRPAATPPPATDYALVDPETGESRSLSGREFLAALGTAMKAGNAARWWKENSGTANGLVEDAARHGEKAHVAAKTAVDAMRKLAISNMAGSRVPSGTTPASAAVPPLDGGGESPGPANHHHEGRHQ